MRRLAKMTEALTAGNLSAFLLRFPSLIPWIIPMKTNFYLHNHLSFMFSRRWFIIAGF